MNWKQWIENWKMTSLRISAPFLQMQWEPRKADRDAAWELYIELLTRITTQPLALEEGDEKTALDSIYSLFPLTRDTIRRHGKGCVEFTKIAVVVLNQIARPFTAKWHRRSGHNAFEDPSQCAEFRRELADLQDKLRRYTGMLGEMAGVEEDLLSLESGD